MTKQRYLLIPALAAMSCVATPDFSTEKSSQALISAADCAAHAVNGKVTLCHDGSTITIALAGCNGHSRHRGDSIGPCGTPPGNPCDGVTCPGADQCNNAG